MDLASVVILLVCLLFSTVFSALYQCLADLSRTSLDELADRRRAGRRKRSQIAAINADVGGHARSAALARILCNLAMVLVALKVVVEVRASAGFGWTDGAIAMLGTAVLVWLSNVALSESIAAHVGERMVYAFSMLVRIAHVVQRPVAPVSKIVDAAVRVVTGAKEMNKAETLEHELQAVIEEGEREGQIDERERDMIEAVVNFKDRTVEQIMTPRNEIEALELTNNLGTITAFVRKARHSRIPVYKGSLDDIVGFFYVKDLLRWLAGEGPRNKNGGFDLRAILRPAMLVPETKTIRALAEEFVEKKVHVAVVADEYGGTAGIVSLEDIVEEVFGEIQDEYEKPEDAPPKIEIRLEERVLDVDARAYIADVNEALEPLGVRVPESDDYDTLGGFVLSTLGRMPSQNESFTHDGESDAVEAGSVDGGPGRPRMIVTVLEATPTRVVRVRIIVKHEDGEAAAPDIVTGARIADAERVKG